MSLDKATSTVIKSIYASQIYSSGALNGYLLKYSSSAQSWIPSDIITATSLSAVALSGTYFGDGSNLKGVLAAGGFATDVTKVPLAGGTMTGALIGTAASFNSITGKHYGDGSSLTGVVASGGFATDVTKLPLAGGTLTGGLIGTTASFNSITAPTITGKHYGDGSSLVGVVATGGNATDSTKLPLAGGTLTGALRGTTATFSNSVSAPTMIGTFYGDGSNLTGISFDSGVMLPNGTNGQVLTFNGTTGSWVASASPAGGGGSASLSTNILTGTGSTTYPLTYFTNQNAANYMAFVGGVAQRPGIDFSIQGSNVVFGSQIAIGTEILVYSPTSITSVNSIGLPSGSNGQVLTYNGSTATWIASAAPTGGGGGGSLPTGLAGQILAYNSSTGTWVASSIPTINNVDNAPIGSVNYFAAAVPPVGYLECNGAVVSQNTYAELYQVIGTMYNTGGEGTGNFRLPDLRGEFIRGWDKGRGVDAGRALGSNQTGSNLFPLVGSLPADQALQVSVTAYDSVGTNTTTGRVPASINSSTSTYPMYGLRPRNVALMPCIKALKTVTGSIQSLNFIEKPTQVTDGQSLVYSSSTNKWVAGAATGGSGGVDTIPIGSVNYFAAITPPVGYLECNGAVVSQATYSDLYSVIGTLYNIGTEGSGNFRLPDLRGEFVRGWDNGKGVDTGRTFGSKQSDEFKSHSHTTTIMIGDNNVDGVDSTTVRSGDHHNETRQTAATGGTETRPRNVALLPCIKALKTITGSTSTLNFIEKPTQVADGQALVYNSSTNKWIAGTVATGGLSASGMDTIPIGSVSYFATITPPTGYLECNGSTISRSTYSELYQVLGTRYNNGNEPANTFRLPDLRGEFIRGWDNGRGIDVGRAFGTIQTDDIKSHAHTLNKVLSWPSTAGNLSVAEQNQSGGPEDHSMYSPRTNSEGGSETRPHNVALLPCIKALGTVNGAVQIANFINKPSTANNGQVLTYNATSSTWIAAAPVSGGEGSLPSGTNGQVLTYSGLTNTWIASSAPLPAVTETRVLRMQEYEQYSSNGSNTQSSFALIDTDKRVRVNGESASNVKFGTQHVYGNYSIMSLPNNEKAKKVFNMNRALFVISESGKAYACGFNGEGQLGIGTNVAVTKLTQITALPTTIDQIWINGEQVESYSTYGLTTDGKLYAWGYNQYGQLGTGNTTSYYSPQLVLGPGNAFGNSTATVLQVITIGGYDGNSHPVSVAALLSNGTVYCMGYGGRGQMGNGTTTAVNSTWVRVETSNGVPLAGITKIGGTGYDAYTSFYALRNDGSLFSWGSNAYGECGLNNTLLTTRPSQMLTTNISTPNIVDLYAVSMSGGAFIFVKNTDGAIYACGYNGYGNLGLGDTTNRSILTRVTSLNGYSVDYLRNVGNASAPHVIAVVKNSSTVQLLGTGHNAQGQLGLNDTTDRNSFTVIPFYSEIGIRDVFATYRIDVGGFTMITTKDGKLYGMGYNGPYHKFTSTDAHVVAVKHITSWVLG